MSPPSVRVLPLRLATDAALAGAKAARLAQLLEAGFPVPPGVVLTTEVYRERHTPAADRAIAEAAAQVTWPVAVRSSAVGEDAPSASHAGMFETVLDVRNEDGLAAAVRRCWESADASRVQAYRGARETEMAVLVQEMLQPEAAGVLFTADPLTGEPHTVLSAVHGLGEQLVSGQATPEEWVIQADRAIRRASSGPHVIQAEQARALASLAGEIARLFGRPQDIEWAIADGRIWVLQARPMTALPEPVEWTAPAPGAYARNFRFGEWLADPVTPLFESWALTPMEERMHAIYASIVGETAARPLHVIVNGWYYYSLNFIPGSPVAALRTLGHLLPAILTRPRRVAVLIPPLAHLGVGLYEREWRDDLLPRYRARALRATNQVTTLPIDELPGLVDELVDLAGEYFTSITFVAGHAWKSELGLARFYARELAPVLGGSHLDLLHGLVPPNVPAHSVSSLDWYQPTLGERGLRYEDPRMHERAAWLAARRLEFEARAEQVLRVRSRALRRFQRLLMEAQRAHRVREEQVSEFTLLWPLLRQALARLGVDLVRRGALATSDDIHFLTLGELHAALNGDVSGLQETASARRQRWNGQRRLAAPLVIGHLPRLAGRVLGGIAGALRSGQSAPPGALIGVPAAAGRASGPARVVHTLEAAERLRPGDVLVTRVTTPAWTPLFAKVAAVVTDVGSASSHASIIGREYGIPVVVGCGNATTELSDGEPIEVDGGAGFVRPLGRA